MLVIAPSRKSTPEGVLETLAERRRSEFRDSKSVAIVFSSPIQKISRQSVRLAADFVEGGALMIAGG